MYNLENKASTDEENKGDDENDKRGDGKDDEDKLNDFDLDKSLMDSIFGEESCDEEENEVDEYLKHKPVRNVDPLSWWKTNENKFPFLGRLSKELFGISATLVPSERLFSDVRNLITNKRSSLKPEKVEKLIFLKRNADLLNIL